MATRQSFGRRAVPQTPRQRALPVAAIAPAEIPVERAFSLDMESGGPSVEREIEEWRQARSFKIPWRQLSLMASLCFGLASFVLPDSVNGYVDWALYGLSAMSLYVWFSNRRAKTKT
jgi:hypothetical protein